VGSVGILSAQDATGTQRSVQIVDTRPKSDFDAGHIPGAIWMGWEEWTHPAPVSEGSILRRPGYWGVLRDRPSGWYADRLAAQGLRGDDPIVTYADGPRSRGGEGRIAWMLLYLGAAAVSLLDGGWQTWVQMGGDVERERVNPPQGVASSACSMDRPPSGHSSRSELYRQARSRNRGNLRKEGRGDQEDPHTLEESRDGDRYHTYVYPMSSRGWHACLTVRPVRRITPSDPDQEIRPQTARSQVLARYVLRRLGHRLMEGSRVLSDAFQYLALE
jgi:rhodanese-related sulfurtransferase